MLTFSIKIWNKIGVEVIRYNHKKWIKKQLLVIKIWLVTKLSIILTNLKKCKIQDCEDFQPCRKFIAEELAIHLIINIKTVKAAELKAILGFNQLNPIMTKQQSIGLRIKKHFQMRKLLKIFLLKSSVA